MDNFPIPSHLANGTYQEFEAQFQEVAESAPVLIWLTDKDKLCTWINKPWLDFVGRTLAQELGNGWTAGLHPDDLCSSLQGFHAAFDARQEYQMEYRLRRHDGVYRWMLTHGVPRYSHGEFVGYVSSCIDITVYKQEHEALGELSHKFQSQSRIFDTALSSLTDLVYVFDSDLRVVYANKALLELWGMTLDQVRGKTFLDLKYPPELAARLEAQMREVLTTGKVVSDETSYVSPTGHAGWHEYAFNPVYSADGTVEAIAGSTRIVTERKRAETIREAQRHVLEQMATDTPLAEILNSLVLIVELEAPSRPKAAIQLLDMEGRRLHLGAAPHLPKSYNDAIEGIEIGPEVGSCGAAAFHREPVFVYDIASDARWINGRELALSHGLRSCWSVPIFSSTGRVLGTFALYYPEPKEPTPEDLTVVTSATQTASIAIERRQADDELKDTRARLDATLAAGEIGTWTWDITNNKVVADKNLTHFFPIKPGEPQGETIQKYLESIHPDDRMRVQRGIMSFVESDQTDYESDYRIIKADGSIGWITARGKIERDANGKAVRFPGVLIDITERKLAEQALQETRQRLASSNEDLERRVEERTASLKEAVQQMEEFSYTVSHDLRAPLRAMHAYTGAVMEDFGDTLPPEGRRYLQRVLDNAVRLDKMIIDVLTFSRISRDELQIGRVSLNVLVREITDHYAGMQPPDSHIQVDLLHDVMAHEPSLTQAISNLLSNAIKFVPHGVLPEVQVRTEQQGSTVTLWIEDNGIGIEPEYQHRLFGMFERIHPTLNYDGTGVGLAITRKAVERMGGKVGVVSDGINGSKFWVQLKAAETWA